MRSVRLATAIVLLAVLSGTSVKDALAAEKAIWGPGTLPGGASSFPTYRELGVDTLQLQIYWSDVAPTRPRDP